MDPLLKAVAGAGVQELLSREPSLEELVPRALRARPRRMTNAAAVVARVVARRHRRSALIWGGTFALLIVSSVSGYSSAYPDVADRLQLAGVARQQRRCTRAVRPGCAPRHGRRLHRVASRRSWSCWSVAMWGLLLATKALRGEEDEGRIEVLFSGPVTPPARNGGDPRRPRGDDVDDLRGPGHRHGRGRRRGRLLLGVCRACGSRSRSRSVPPSSSPSARSHRRSHRHDGWRRRSPASRSGPRIVVRVVADAGSKGRWLSWLTPFGWVERMRPLTGTNVAPLVPAVVAIAALVVATFGWPSTATSVERSFPTDRQRIRTPRCSTLPPASPCDCGAAPRSVGPSVSRRWG